MPLLECEYCHSEYPVNRFPNLQAGLICHDCMTGENTKKVDAALKLKAKAMVGELSNLSGEDIGNDAGKVKAIVADIYRDFGGPKSFASHFHWVIMELSRRKPIPASVGHLMLNLLKLHHTIEQTEEQTAAREMSDEQLRRETELATVELLVNSAVDPDKRRMLESILGQHGLEIKEADPHALIEAAAHKIVEDGHKGGKEDQAEMEAP